MMEFPIADFQLPIGRQSDLRLQSAIGNWQCNDRGDATGSTGRVPSVRSSANQNQTSRFRQLVGLAALAVAPAVGLGVAGEFPLLRVPLQLAAVPVGEVRQVADGHAAGADLDV